MAFLSGKPLCAPPEAGKIAVTFTDPPGDLGPSLQTALRTRLTPRNPHMAGSRETEEGAYRCCSQGRAAQGSWWGSRRKRGAGSEGGRFRCSATSWRGLLGDHLEHHLGEGALLAQ